MILDSDMLMGATIAQLREYAKSNGMKGFTTLSKAELIEFIKRNTQSDSVELPVKETKKRGRKPKAAKTEDQEVNEQASKVNEAEIKEEEAFSGNNTNNNKKSLTENEENKSDDSENKNNKLHVRDNNRPTHTEQNGSNLYTPRNQTKPNRNYYSNTALPDILNSNECGEATGILEMHPDGYGFLRTAKFMENSRDVYVSIAQIRRFNLRSGDKVSGKTRPLREGERYFALLYITSINDENPDKSLERKLFDDLTPIYPNKRISMESKTGKNDMALRIIDMVAPIGFGQRALIVSQPKAGKTVLLKNIANAISENYPEAEIMVLLIDERPEEVTDMKRSIKGDVIYSTFDELPDNHTHVAESVLDRAQRAVECGKDVVILMDSLTRLARAYNQTAPTTGRTLTGGLDMGALHKPKKFFGAARKIEEGGSLTIIATALIETGSRMDDIIYEEFKGTGNCEIHLDRKLSERRVFPAIDITKSGTRREEALLTPEELNGIWSVRKIFASTNTLDATEQFINMLLPTKNNSEFLIKLKDWITLMERDGFKLVNQDKQ